MKATALTLFLSAALFTFSCKDKKEDKSMDADSTTNTGRDITGDTATRTTEPAPTTSSISEDQLKDAVKDYPDVTATVNNGEVTLTGSVKRAELPKLMQRVQALNPTKVNNNLTIK
jgi:osmotically-inducible protein OsmY